MTDETIAAGHPARPGFLATVGRHWLLVALITAAVTAGTWVAAQRPPSTYDAVAVVSFLPVEGFQADLLRLTLPRYQAYASSTDQLNAVADELGLSQDEVRGAVEVQIPAESPNVTITATTTSAEDSAAIANRLAELTSDFADQDALVRPAEIQRATVATEPSGPPRLLLTVAGFLVALGLGVLAAVLLERYRPTVRTRRDLERVADGRPIVVVPDDRAIRTDPQGAAATGHTGAAGRHLRTAVSRLAGDDDGRTVVVAVTGSDARAGAGQVAGLLAGSFARDERTVVLVDPGPDAGPGRAKPARPEPADEPADDTGTDDTDDTGTDDTGTDDTGTDDTGTDDTGTDDTDDTGNDDSTEADEDVTAEKDDGADDPGGDDPGAEDPARDAGRDGADGSITVEGGGSRITRSWMRGLVDSLDDEVLIVEGPPPDVDDGAVVAAGAADVTVVVVRRRITERAMQEVVDEMVQAAAGPVLVVGYGFAD